MVLRPGYRFKLTCFIDPYSISIAAIFDSIYLANFLCYLVKFSLLIQWLKLLLTWLLLNDSRRRRGTVKASITRLTSKLSELERASDDPTTLGHTQRMLSKLALDRDYKTYHYSIIDLIADDEDTETNLVKEQDELDNQDADVADLYARIEKLIDICKSKADTAPPRVAGDSLTKNPHALFSCRSLTLPPLMETPSLAELLGTILLCHS